MHDISEYQTGTGTGVITRDGCAVDVYEILPAGDEPRVIHEAAGPGASILELGAGAGRVTHPLVALGHPVVAVDESADMLARITGAQTVCADIRLLDLGRRFDVVVLGSQLINIPDAGLRASFLACCARHVAPGGQVLIQQAPGLFFDGFAPQRIVQDGLTTVFRNIRRPAPGQVGLTIEYRRDGGCWTQSIVCERFDRAELAEHGLRPHRELTADGAWFSVVPASSVVPG